MTTKTPYKGHCADSGEKREPASDIDTALMDSLKALDPKRPIREADINCRDRDVRSLVGPEPDRQVFAKFQHLLRKAAARSAETICVTIGEILRAFTPTECANYFRNSDYAPS